MILATYQQEGGNVKTIIEDPAFLIIEAAKALAPDRARRIRESELITNGRIFKTFALDSIYPGWFQQMQHSWHVNQMIDGNARINRYWGR
jgi:hypothetical protein